MSCFVFVFLLVKEGGDGCLFILFYFFGKGGGVVICVSCFCFFLFCKGGRGWLFACLVLFLDVLFVFLLHLYSSSHSFIFAYISLLVINEIP